MNFRKPQYLGKNGFTRHSQPIAASPVKSSFFSRLPKVKAITRKSGISEEAAKQIAMVLKEMLKN
ncbi:MAG: hypothetical protein HQK83_15535 [Fibrobacteria bacterium]|nr:hypothetical protein [Fibrobacteria bacterium]